MKVVITGGLGFLGRKLADRILARGQLKDASGQNQAISELLLFDAVAAPAGAYQGDNRVATVQGDITDRAQLDDLFVGADSIVHLAAVVSAGAEADFELGFEVNLDGTRAVLEAARATGRTPKLLFASSAAAYGGALPAVVEDDTPLTPQTSYGAQKVIGELLLNDYSRKGFLDGRAMRLPTISVRPGKPNRAASGFASGIFREPLNGVDFTCPVTPESAMALMSPRKVIDAFMRMHDLDSAKLGYSRTLLLSGIRVTMAEAAAAVEALDIGRPLGKISFEQDPAIQAIVDLWPQAMRSARAEALGFGVDLSVEEIIQVYVDDELGGA